MSHSEFAGPGAADAFSTAFAALVTDDDVIGTITRLMLGCVESVAAESAGLVVVVEGAADQLELLASTSHRATELELYQLQSGDGPCVEAVRVGEPVIAANADQVAARWPDLHGAFVAAGYSAVRATPLRWHGSILGALNVFWADGVGAATSAEDATLMQSFADVATIAILHAGWISPAHLVERARSALAGRAIIEQAKGVLAHQQSLELPAAYDALVDLARGRDLSLSTAAARVIDDAIHRPIDTD